MEFSVLTENIKIEVRVHNSIKTKNINSQIIQFWQKCFLVPTPQSYTMKRKDSLSEFLLLDSMDNLIGCEGMYPQGNSTLTVYLFGPDIDANYIMFFWSL